MRRPRGSSSGGGGGGDGVGNDEWMFLKDICGWVLEAAVGWSMILYWSRAVGWYVDWKQILREKWFCKQKGLVRGESTEPLHLRRRNAFIRREEKEKKDKDTLTILVDAAQAWSCLGQSGINCCKRKEEEYM